MTPEQIELVRDSYALLDDPPAMASDFYRCLFTIDPSVEGLFSQDPAVMAEKFAAELGAIVQAGQTVYTLTLDDPVWIRAYVAQPRLGRIKPGMPVKVAIDSMPGRQYDGTVGFISPQAEFTPKTVQTEQVRDDLVYRIRVIASDPDNVFRQGMPVTVLIAAAPAAAH